MGTSPKEADKTNRVPQVTRFQNKTMKEKSEHLEGLENRLKDSFHRKVVELYKEQPTSSHIIVKLIHIIENKKNEIDKSENSGV